MNASVAVSVLVSSAAATSLFAGISVTPFGPSVFNANPAVMDAALGITGYTVESFTDTSLAPGLMYQLSSPSAYGPAAVTLATMQSTVDPGGFNNHWDDNYILVNTFNNTFPDNGFRALTTTFYFPAGTTSVGIGISNAQSASLPNQYPVADHRLFINGVDFGLLESFSGFVAGRNRNIYLRMDATGIDTITSVAITTLNNRFDDVMIFDHIAFIPAPGAAAALALCGVGFLKRRR